MSKSDDDHDRDSDHAHANDNGKGEHEPGSKIAPAPAGGALTSLAALQTALAGVNTAAIIGRTGLPMLLFKREGSGTWMFGQKKTIPEPGSRWAVNPMTFKYGFICFNDNKVVGEHLVSVSQPKPLITDMQDVAGLARPASVGRSLRAFIGVTTWRLCSALILLANRSLRLAAPPRAGGRLSRRVVGT